MFEIVDTFIDNLLQSLGVWGPILGCILMIVESIFPILPLFVFITLNFLTFGNILGFFISWFFTLIGCLISFIIFRKNLQTWWYKKLKKKGLISIEAMNKLTSLKFEQLVTIVALPFTPAFLVNIACGLSKMSYKKFLLAIIIGKIFVVYFWGFIGVSLLESIKNPVYLIRVGLLLVIAYLISMFINKKLKIVD